MSYYNQHMYESIQVHDFFTVAEVNEIKNNYIELEEIILEEFFETPRSKAKLSVVHIMNRESNDITSIARICTVANNYISLEGVDDPEKSFSKIYSYGIANNKDVMAGMRTGENSTYRIYWNPHTFEFTRPEQSIFYPKEQEGMNSDEKPISEEADPEQIPAPEMANRIISGIYSVGCLEETVVGAAATAVNNDNLSDVGQSISRYASIFTQVATLTVGLNTELCAGDIISCIFPKVSTENEVDPAQSGLYIIKEISHFSQGNRSYSALKVIRDTSGE